LGLVGCLEDEDGLATGAKWRFNALGSVRLQARPTQRRRINGELVPYAEGLRVAATFAAQSKTGRLLVVVQQRKGVVASQLFAALQEIQFHDEPQPRDVRTQRLCQLHRRVGRAPGS